MGESILSRPESSFSPGMVAIQGHIHQVSINTCNTEIAECGWECKKSECWDEDLVGVAITYEHVSV